MNFLFSILSLVFIAATAIDSSVIDSESEQTAQLEFVPARIDTTFGGDRFFSYLVKCVNIGNDTLAIDRVYASCYCGSATILNSSILPGDTGKMMLYVNKDGLTDANSIEFNVKSNSAVPVSMRITFTDLAK